MSDISHGYAAFGRWSAPVRIADPPPPPAPSPVAGVYDTEVAYGGRTYAENHQLWVAASQCCVLGVLVVEPKWEGRTVSFTNQPDATRAGKPWAASITFDQGGFAGWCQFPGEGPIEWRGRLVGSGPPLGEWETDVWYGGAWMSEDHRLRIAPGVVEVAGIPVVEPIFTADTLTFANQPRAARGGLPEAGWVRFSSESGFEGECRFPGEGPIPWRSRPLPPRPRLGVYQTMVGYGGTWYAEDHPVAIRAAEVRIAGVPVVNPVLTETTLDFAAQPDASRGGKPWAGHLRFEGDDCSGWCQFPGEGPVDWRGRRSTDP